MGRQIKTIYKKAESSFNNPEHKKKWQGGIGILVMVVFVLSSVLFNNTVQALNQAAGNYGYYSGSYGYGGASDSSRITSDAPPAVATVSIANRSAGGLTVTATAPTLTTLSTSIEGTGTLYLYSGSSCSGTAVTSGSAAAGGTLSYEASSDTSSGTTYTYCAKYTDVNLNDSTAATGSSVGYAVSSGGGSYSPSQTIGQVPTPTQTVSQNTPVAPSLGKVNLGNTAEVANAYNVTQANLEKKLPAVGTALTNGLKGVGLTDLGTSGASIKNVFAGIMAKGGFLSTDARISSYLNVFFSEEFGLGKAALQEIATLSPENLKIVIESVIAPAALGNDVKRTPELAKASPKTNAKIEKLEKNSIGIIGKTIGADPKVIAAAAGVKTHSTWFEVVHRFANNIVPGTFNKDRELKANDIVYKKFVKGKVISGKTFKSLGDLGTFVKNSKNKASKQAVTLYNTSTRLSNAVAYSGWDL
ncbi:MAG: hypothetical protein Q7S16_00170 [bacterium]|nr:hypothetical protein [bacterium]